MLLQSFLIAFSMYSALPMPQADWNERNMRYVFCFFPLIGAVVGLVLFAWVWLAQTFHIDGLLFAAVFTLLPVAVTGGIHLDGYCDVSDALASHQTREKKLEILKDPHCGAFAMIALLAYFLLYAGAADALQFHHTVFIELTLGLIFLRVLSGFSVCSFRCARESGLARTFADNAAKRRVRFILLVTGVLVMAAAILYHPVYGLAVTLCGLFPFFFYRFVSYRQFGGITGDLAGWFLQLAELLMLFSFLLVQKGGIP